MTLYEIVTFVSILIACLAALYARWTWTEAKRANDIAVHDKQFEIYKSFEALRFAMLQKACGITHEETGRFYFPSSDAEFYFEESLFKKIKEYFEVCFELAEWNRKIQRGNLSEEDRDTLHKEQDKLLEKEETLYIGIDNLLKKTAQNSKISQIYCST